MLCAELERLEAEFDDILDELENPALTDEQKVQLRTDYARMIEIIKKHQAVGHDGRPCFEE